MTNKIGYNQYPSADEFSDLYKRHTQQELADIYGCTKKRIHKWIIHFGLELRPQGGGNNRKYDIDFETLQKLLIDGYTNKEICHLLNIKRSSLYNWINKFELKRDYKTEDKQIYARRVRWLSEKNYVLYKDILNPNNYPRTLCGVKDGYQLDHKKSIVECFHEKLSAEFCSSLENLQFIPWQENLKRRTFKKAK
jgi:hypothetical protein